MSAGVLNQEQMRDLIVHRHIVNYCNNQSSPDPSAIDLPLGTKFYKVKASCRPKSGQSIDTLIEDLRDSEERQIDPDGTLLERDSIYVIPVAWELALPQNVQARSTAKSSIGRLDVLVRLLADGHQEFDRVTRGKRTKLYIEVVPLTFPILIRPNSSLSQLRFIKGDESSFHIPSHKLVYEDQPILVDREGVPIDLTASQHREGALLTLNLEDDSKLQCVGFCAKGKDSGLPPIDTNKSKCYDPTLYWDKVHRDASGGVLIKADSFYIFRSKERFKIPPHVAVECQAYSESLGDIRIHYAGFAHPYFGYEKSNGTPLIFEVRGFSVDTMLWDESPLARVHFWRMSRPAERPDDDGYTKQELKLSKCFKEWGEV